tara:strand:+ start:55 stop:735 length:681 start_codon:yes stop_codon:yes gene_type:complete
MASTNTPKDIRYTPTPNSVFGKLLNQIDDINDLKFILRIIWMINQIKRVPKYLTIEEIMADKIVHAIISTKSDIAMHATCLSMIKNPQFSNLLICHEIGTSKSTSTVVAFNTTRNKTMLNKTQQLDKSDSVFQPDGDVSAESPNIFKLYEDNIGTLNPIIADELKIAETTYPNSWITSAFKESVLRNKRSWNYIKTILENWHREGKNDGRIGEHSKKSGYNQYFRR